VPLLPQEAQELYLRERVVTDWTGGPEPEYRSELDDRMISLRGGTDHDDDLPGSADLVGLPALREHEPSQRQGL